MFRHQVLEEFSNQELKSCFNQKFRLNISRRPDNVCSGLVSFLARSTDLPVQKQQVVEYDLFLELSAIP